MKKYMANDPYFIQGHRDVAARLRSGTSFVSFDNSAVRGGTLKIAMSEKDRTPVFFTAGGILKNAPHPNAAKLLVTWMLSEERHNPALYSPRGDMPPPAGMPSLMDPASLMAIAIFSATERGSRRYGSASKLLSGRSLIRPHNRLLCDAVYEVSYYFGPRTCVQWALGTAESPTLLARADEVIE